MLDNRRKGFFNFVRDNALYFEADSINVDRQSYQTFESFIGNNSLDWKYMILH